MPYVKKLVYLKDSIEVSKYYSGRIGKKIHNAPSRGKTPLHQLQYQDRKAERAIYWLLDLNFKPYTDLFITLTYKAQKTISSIHAKNDIKKYLARLRLEYKKQGKELKYIYVAGRGKRGNVHYHMVINKFDTEILANIWRNITGGNIHIVHLYGSFKKLASYLVKNSQETFYSRDKIHQKRYCTSHDLKRPLIKREIIKSIKWLIDPRPIKGYRLDEHSLYNGYGYFDAGGCYASTRLQSYTLIQIKQSNQQNKKYLSKLKSDIDPINMPEWTTENN